ncbi:hypothetical protein E8E14_002930 [Neopestalotiopsis sp. 37M]|nr:hypothetical protein E8E14_002930 [Neopestalotiopsis sp. 37M]
MKRTNTCSHQGALSNMQRLPFAASASFKKHPDISVLGPFGNKLEEVGKQWALRAGGQVLQDMDQPTLDSVQACQVLAIYWFAYSDHRRNNTFSAIAYRAIRTMATDEREEDIPDVESPGQLILHENIRRCFWTSWMANCVDSDHYVVGSSIDPVVLDLPLPISEEAYRNGEAEYQGNLAQFVEDRGARETTGCSTTISVKAELMKMVLTWARVCDHMEMRKRVPMSETITSLFALDHTIRRWNEGLPEAFKYNRENLHEQLVVKQEPFFSTIHTSYHQFRLVLHSTLVPGFGGRAAPEELPLEFVEGYARVALNSVQTLSTIARDLQAIDWDPATLAPFMGYCMYASTTIHVNILKRTSHAAATTRSNILAALRLLQGMKPHWRYMERFVRALLSD